MRYLRTERGSEMAKLASVFISARNRRLVVVAVWLAAFLTMLATILAVFADRSRDIIRLETGRSAESIIVLRNHIGTALRMLHETANAPACSPAFHEQLRQVSYLPDGLNEFIYAPGGRVACSVNTPNLVSPIDLGTPDHVAAMPNGRIDVWLDRELSFLGLPGARGSIVLSEPFGAVVPKERYVLDPPDWLHMEVVLAGAGGRHWHRAGTPGVYAGIREQGQPDWLWRALNFANVTCDDQGQLCVAAQASVIEVVARDRVGSGIAILGAALLSGFIAMQAGQLVGRHFSFEARFRRHLDASSVICAYQPVMDLETGQITGCEVLARWRDIDDNVVYPDAFVPLLEKHGTTLAFTEMVAARAFEELSSALPAGRKLQVNFNIFPRDLDRQALDRAYLGFTSQPDRFDVVLEIIESDQFPITAQRDIERLRAAGIRVYIDDFGTGYSNMQSLAALSVDGVKLDRSFAMAPDDSMMARMLGHAVEMIHTTRRAMVVEGVETAERLRVLRQMSTRIDYVQGYFISRPLDIAAFVDFLATWPGAHPDLQERAA